MTRNGSHKKTHSTTIAGVRIAQSRLVDVRPEFGRVRFGDADLVHLSLPSDPLRPICNVTHSIAGRVTKRRLKTCRRCVRVDVARARESAFGGRSE